MTDEEEAQAFLDRGFYPVRDVKTVKQHIKPGCISSKRQYNRLCRLIAETGCLYLPFREHPEVKKLLKEVDDGKLSQMRK